MQVNSPLLLCICAIESSSPTIFFWHGFLIILIVFFFTSVRNGTEGPDLGMVGGLWAQYQNALAVSAGVKLPAGSPPQTEPSLNSPSMENPDETSSSGQKDDDDVSEDDSEDRIDQNAHDPERLKAFNVSLYLHSLLTTWKAQETLIASKVLPII